MALIQCQICRINTLTGDKCQHCGSPLKMSMWKRPLRKREAYGVVLIVLGIALLIVMKLAGVATILIGSTMIVAGFLRPRVKY